MVTATDLKRVIDQVSREKGVDREVLIKTLEEAVKAAAKKKLGPNYDLEVTFNDEMGEIEVFEFKQVVEKVTEKDLEVSIEEAHRIDPESQVGDSLGIKMDTDEFGRIAAQSAAWSRVHGVRGCVPEMNATRSGEGQSSRARPPVHGSIHTIVSSRRGGNGVAGKPSSSRFMIRAHTGIAIFAAGRVRLRGWS